MSPRLRAFALAVLALAVAGLAMVVAWPSCDARPGRRPDARPAGAAEDTDEDSALPGIGRREAMAAAVGSVEAEVVDGDGAPLPGGRVVLRCLLSDDEVRAIDGGVVELDEEGHFVGPGCRGRVCAELRHAGYVPAEPWMLTPGRTVILDARPLRHFLGEVVDGAGGPVVDASVVVTAVPGEDPSGVLPFTSSNTRTDEDGAFSLAWIERPPCGPCDAATRGCEEAPLPTLDRILLTVRADGHGPGELAVDLDEEADGVVVVTLPRPSAPIRGTLLDPDGVPYPRAYVLARSESRPAEQQRAEPGADDGVFAFEQLGDGSYTLRALQDGVALDRLEGVEARTGTEPVEMVGPRSRDLIVEVVDDEDRPVVGASVQGGPFARARTDETGRVLAADVADGAYMLRIRPPRSPMQLHSVEVGDGAGEPAVAAGPNPQIARIRTSSPPQQ